MPTNQTSTHVMSPRRQRNRNLMIQSILETARAIMLEEGVAALSMQELARRLDMRAPSLYNYFSSKMDIYNALFRLGFTLFGEHMDKVVEGAQTWQEELRHTFEAYMTFAIQNPDLYQLCFERPVPGFVPSDESLQVSFGRLQKSYERAARLLTVIDTGLPSEQTADLIIAMMHGLTALHMSNEPHLPVGQGRFGALIPAALSVLGQAWSRP
jgi:AcrR family transcriptional regulator